LQNQNEKDIYIQKIRKLFEINNEKIIETDERRKNENGLTDFYVEFADRELAKKALKKNAKKESETLFEIQWSNDQIGKTYLKNCIDIDFNCKYHINLPDMKLRRFFSEDNSGNDIFEAILFYNEKNVFKNTGRIEYKYTPSGEEVFDYYYLSQYF
jgi:hypothetical protein